MKYSVVTACLNSSATIQRTIDSVLKQNILPAEYVFVDGGSTDGTVEIIEDAIQRAEATSSGVIFKLINQKPGQGIYNAWNIALGVVQSEIICILNSDDWYFPHTMQTVIQQFSADSSAEIVLGDGYYFSPDNPSLNKICRVRPFWVFPFAMTVIHPACFVRKIVYDRLGGFDERFRVAADYDFVYRCFASRVKFTHAGEVLVNVQMGGFSEQNRELAAREVARIGGRYAALKPLPRVAHLMRMIGLRFGKS